MGKLVAGESLTGNPSLFQTKNEAAYHPEKKNMAMTQYNMIVYIRPKRVCCPRPRGNIQREAKKRGRREHFGHWGS